MKVLKHHLSTALKETFAGKPWYGDALMEKLNSLNHQVVNLIPQGLSYSIAKQIKHVISWRNFVIEKLNGNVDYNIEINSAIDWPDVQINSDSDWKELLEELVASQKELLDLLSDKSDAFLESQVPNHEYNFHFLIEGIIQHDVYHQGQIAVIASLLKS
ncbi:MAG: DinB family protein [Bacteroidota bacterium]